MTVPACEASSGPNLGALLEGYASIPSGLDRIVTAVCDDSRAVAPGAVFFARRGLRVDGRRFAARAVASGAAAVVTGGEPAPARLDGGAVVVTVPDVAGALGHAASRFFADPSEHLSVAAVTGTNGKTSVTHLTARACGEERSAVMGTLGAGPLGRLEAVALTTPGPIEIHRRLAAMRDAGMDMFAMEVSSHALDQRRIEGVRVDTAVFTNLSRDHLDYHPDMGAYARAKASLFDVPDLAHAVINVDDRVGARARRHDSGRHRVRRTDTRRRASRDGHRPDRRGPHRRGTAGAFAARRNALGRRNAGYPASRALQRTQPARGGRGRVPSRARARRRAPAA